MADEAQRGLDWRREFGRGGTEVGIARARDIANKRDLSMDTVRRMVSYFARHEVDKEAEGFRPGEDGYPSNGRIAWALWGGDPGQSWANRIASADEDDRAEKRPYPGEHAARINDPDKYDSFRRVNDEGGDGVDFVYGILPDGGVEIESIRFDADEFTVEQARQWLEDNDFTAIKFEPATGSSERSETVLHSVQIMGTDMANREVRSRLEGAEIRSEDGEIRVSGYAAVFGEETNIGGMFTESIARGAFKNAIDRQDDVVFLINHDGLPLARTRSGTLKLSEDERGLFMEASLDMEDPDVRSIVPKMKRGDLDKMSFAFIPDRQEWDDSGDMPKRTIQDLRLYDVSIVTTPAYDGTEIGLRSLEAYRQAQKKSQAPRRLRMKAKLKG
jgi:HK97 family phage prohead protease